MFDLKLPCLPLIEERFVRTVRKQLVKDEQYYPCIEMRMFPQVWGSTALGFGGIGGQALTSSYTTVVSDINRDWHIVFFGEQAAYLVTEPNGAFFEDLKRGQMASVLNARKYNKEEV